MAYQKGYTPKPRKPFKPKFRGKYKKQKFEGPLVDEHVESSWQESEHYYGSDHDFHQHAYGWEVIRVWDDYYMDYDHPDQRPGRCWELVERQITNRIDPSFKNPTIPEEFEKEGLNLAPQIHRAKIPETSSEAEESIVATATPDIENALSDYLAEIHGFAGTLPPHRVPPRFERILDETGHLDKLKPFIKTEEGRNFVTFLVVFSPFWVRRLEDWSGGDSDSLFKHLLTVYDVPDCLLKFAQSGRSDFDFSKWTLWLILLGQGGSLKKAASVFYGWRISKKLIPALYAAPDAWSGESVSLYAEVLQAGGSMVEYARVSRINQFQRDYSTDFLSDVTFLHWTVQWLAKYRDEIDDDECFLIIFWVIHTQTEQTRINREGPAQNPWQGRSAARVLELAREYEAEQQRQYDAYQKSKNNPSQKWEERGWNLKLNKALEIVDSDPVWTFTELIDRNALIEEGSLMRHCVGSYSSYCSRGQSVIVSLRKKGRRTLTIEISGLDGRLVQAYGKRNRTATGKELAVVKNWMDAVVRV